MPQIYLRLKLVCVVGLTDGIVSRRLVALSFILLSSLIMVPAISWNMIGISQQQQAFAQYGSSGSIIYADITEGSASKSDDAYAPNPIRANVGDTVVWTNQDSTIHTVTAGSPAEGATGEFGGAQENPELIFAGGTFEHTFEAEGEFPYWCTLHPAMVGTVIVSGSGADDDPNIDSLYTDRSFYSVGETVNVNGQVSGGETNQYVTVTVANSAGVIFKVDQFHPNIDGSFSYSFILSGANAIPGSWSVMTGYGTQSASVAFNVTEEDEDDSTTLPLTIESVTMTDTSGDTIDTIQLGTRGIISISLANTQVTQQPLNLIVQVENSDGVTDYLSWQSTSIFGSQSINAGFTWTPSTSGSYEIKVFAWESVNSPVPLADPGILTVSVSSPIEILPSSSP